MRHFGTFALLAFIITGCATLDHRPSEPKRERKATRVPAPFLVESFRCSMQPTPSLSIGIRVYSSIDGKETALIYGPDRMDSPPVENDSFLYYGAKAILTRTTEGRTLYSFEHPKISLRITVPRSSSKSEVFEAVYSEENGSKGAQGACTRVSIVSY